MSGISHKQAIKWTHRRLDGLLTQSQTLLLDEHLDSCDSCRAYATEINSLPAELQKEFRARWDHQMGPSQNVMEHVTTKARGIPVRRRISSGFKLLAGAATLIMLGFLINLVVSQLQSTSTSASETETANNSALAENRLLAFTSDQTGNYDIYTMHADGSGLTNITNHPADDISPFWSPDGKRIAFMSDRDGSLQIYLMDAGGSNVIQLTNGEGNHYLDVNGYSPWSPDGKQLIVSREQKLYVLDITDTSITTLINEPGSYFLPSWSPDGSYIAFISDTGRIPRDLFVVGSDGNHLVKLTENLPPGEFFLFDYVWSPNGALSFTTSRNQQAFQNATYFSTVYEANADGSMTVIHGTDDRQIIDWWNGITVQQTERYLNWVRPDGSQSTLDLCQPGSYTLGIAHQRSSNGNLVVGSNCSDSGWMLYWANPDGSIINELLNSPIPAKLNTDYIDDIAWSPDDQYLAFVSSDTASADVTQTLYVLDIAKAREEPSVQPLQMTNSVSPSWQPVSNDDVVEENPTPAPTQDLASDRLIAFASEQSGNLDIYTMRADGSGRTNITKHPANDVSPVWSPDGKQIAFMSDRTGFMQVYLMNADGSNVIQLTTEEANHKIQDFNPWSPDGGQLIFLEETSLDEKWLLYVMDADRENRTLLVGEPINYSALSWAPDSKHVAFVAHDPENQEVLRMYVVDAAGTTLTDVTKSLESNERLDGFHYDWSPDGQSVFFVAYKHISEGNDQWTAYEASLDGNQLIEQATSSAPMRDWWEGTSFIAGFDASALTWLRSDGTYSTFKPLENCELGNDSQFGFLAKRSANGNQVINVDCPNDDMWFYYANSDGTVIKPLLGSPLSVREGYIGNIVWSPDDRFIAFNIASPEKTDIFILNIAESLKDPSLRPLQITVGDGFLYYTPSWQPAP